MIKKLLSPQEYKIRIFKPLCNFLLIIWSYFKDPRQYLIFDKKKTKISFILTTSYSRGSRDTKLYVYLPYRGTISFYVYIVHLGLRNIFLHVERDEISCWLQPTRFSRNFL